MLRQAFDVAQSDLEQGVASFEGSMVAIRKEANCKLRIAKTGKSGRRSMGHLEANCTSSDSHKMAEIQPELALMCNSSR